MKKLSLLLTMAALFACFSFSSAFAMGGCDCAAGGKNCAKQPCAMKECPKCAPMDKEAVEKGMMKKGEEMMPDSNMKQTDTKDKKM